MVTKKVLLLLPGTIIGTLAALALWYFGIVDDSAPMRIENLNPLWESLSFQPKLILLGTAFGVGTCLAVTAIRLVLSKLFPGLEGNPPVSFTNKDLSWLSIALIAIASGVCEEVVFRGTMQPMTNYWVTCVVFGLVHLSGFRSDPYVIFAFFTGMFLGWTLTEYQSLWVPLACHVTHNTLALVIQRLTTTDEDEALA